MLLPTACLTAGRIKIWLFLITNPHLRLNPVKNQFFQGRGTFSTFSHKERCYSQCKVPSLIYKTNQTKKLSMISAKKNHFVGGFWFSLTKTDSKVLWLSLMNENPSPTFAFFWLKLFQPYLPGNAFSCEKLGDDVCQPSPFACAILVPQASICCLLIWLRKSAMERLPSLCSHLKDRISLFSLGLSSCVWCSLACLVQWGLPILFQPAEITTFS